MINTTDLEILNYHPSLAPYFESLNREWIEKNYTLEELDLTQLRNPDTFFIQHQGEVFFLRYQGHIVGTIAMKKVNDDIYELSKMAVDPQYRGHGFGRLLMETAINKAREMGVLKVYLYSNTIQSIAIQLYRKMGFEEIPVEPGVYDRANIKMELSLHDSYTPELITHWLDNYGNSFSLLQHYLADIPQDIWQWQPPHGKWTIHQNILHLLDTETHFYIRFRTFLAEPGNRIIGFDQDKWANNLSYHQQDVQTALETYGNLRRLSHQLLLQIPFSSWENTVIHSELGSIKMWQWLKRAQNHHHIFQIQRVHQAWKKSKKI